MRKSAVIALACATGAIAAGALLPRLVAPTRPATAAEAPPTAGPGIPVTPGTVTTADVPVLLNGIGTVQAYNMVTVRSRVDGEITSVGFTEGQQVKAGAKLFQIDARPFQAALDQALANKQQHQAQLVSAQADLVRWAELVPQGVKSRQTYDQQKAVVVQLQAALKGDDAQIQNAQLNLGYADIRSPIDGRLGARLVDSGNMVRATDSAGLVTVAQMQPIFVSFTLSQEVGHKVRENQATAPLQVQAIGNDGTTVLGRGQLTLIDNSIDQTTGTIHLKASFANEDERLWPGEFVNVRVVLSTRKGVPTVPAQSVQDGPNGKYAYVIKSDDTVERRPIDVAVIQDGIAVVTKGLSPGEKIVVDGQFRLTQGARVQLRPAAAGPAG